MEILNVYVHYVCKESGYHLSPMFYNLSVYLVVHTGSFICTNKLLLFSLHV